MGAIHAERKPLALLIPGLDGTGQLYYRQLDGLSPRFRVMPWRFRAGGAFGFDDLIEELGQATDCEESGAIRVIGESFGGTVALHFVLAYPERVNQLVLINTFAHYRRRIRIRLGCTLAPLLSKWWLQSLKNAVTELILASEGILVEDRTRYREIIRQVDPAAYRRRLELVRKVDLRSKVGSIAAPTHIFASGRDKIVASVKEARLMASLIPQARLHVFPRAGHALILTPGFSLADYIT